MSSYIKTIKRQIIESNISSQKHNKNNNYKNKPKKEAKQTLQILLNNNKKRK